MRVFLVIAWLFVGLGGAIYHYGPGQVKLKLDSVDAVIADAKQSIADEDWPEAIKLLDTAMAELPADQTQRLQELRLEKAKTQMMAAQLPEARTSLEGLLAELQSDPDTDRNLLAQTRSALANSQYYITWLMRLEGLPKEEWEPVIESARQHYRFLAENPKEYDLPELALASCDDLESSIRLARMDLAELQGLPLPSQ